MKNEKLKLVKKSVTISLSLLVIISLILPSFVFAQKLEQPENLEEVKEMGGRWAKTTQKELPGILERIWREEVLPIWQKMYDWFMTNIWPKIENWFRKEIEPRIRKEAERRKPIIKKEFQKEKEEMREEVKRELPGVEKTLWEKFKELIK